MHTKRTWVQDTFEVLSAVVNKNYVFKLEDLPGSTDFTSLFQKYRINKILVRVIPKENVFNGAQDAAPQVVDVVDTTSSAAQTQTSALLQYANCKVRTGMRPWTVKFTPSVLYDVGVTQTTTNISAPKYKQWLSSSNINIPHLGYRLQFSPVGTATTSLTYQIITSYYMSFKNVY